MKNVIKLKVDLKCNETSTIFIFSSGGLRIKSHKNRLRQQTPEDYSTEKVNLETICIKSSSQYWIVLNPNIYDTFQPTLKVFKLSCSEINTTLGLCRQGASQKFKSKQKV